MMMYLIRQIGMRLAEATGFFTPAREDLELKQLFEKFSLGNPTASTNLLGEKKKLKFASVLSVLNFQRTRRNFQIMLTQLRVFTMFHSIF